VLLHPLARLAYRLSSAELNRDAKLQPTVLTELGTLDRNGHTWNGRRAWTWTYISDFDRSGYVCNALP
jgi:hypothetical protein